MPLVQKFFYVILHRGRRVPIEVPPQAAFYSVWVRVSEDLHRAGSWTIHGWGPAVHPRVELELEGGGLYRTRALWIVIEHQVNGSPEDFVLPPEDFDRIIRRVL